MMANEDDTGEFQSIDRKKGPATADGMTAVPIEIPCCKRGTSRVITGEEGPPAPITSDGDISCATSVVDSCCIERSAITST